MKMVLGITTPAIIVSNTTNITIDAQKQKGMNENHNASDGNLMFAIGGLLFLSLILGIISTVIINKKLKSIN